jgi:hypothetical protein
MLIANRRLSAMLACPLCDCPDLAALPSVQGREYSHCTVCRLAFMHPADRLPLEQERARYRLHRNDPADPGYRQFLRRLSDPLVEKLPPQAEGLDYGSGPGPTLSVMLQEQGFQMRDYDPCFAPDPSVLRCTYDFVTCTETAEHFHRPREEFDRLNGLIRPGGCLGLMTEWLDGYEDRFGAWWYALDATHVCFYSLQTLNWIAAHWGWSMDTPRRNVTFWRTGTNGRQDLRPIAESCPCGEVVQKPD